MNGGDFSWKFDNNQDDTNYAVNAALMNAIKGYKSKLVKILGE